LLADISLEFGWTRKARRIVEEIMPHVIAGDDIEQRALACFVYGRCIIAADDDSTYIVWSFMPSIDYFTATAGLKEALPYLLIAEDDYRRLEIYSSLADVQYFISIVYHNLDMEKERDAAAKRHQESEEEQKRLDAIVVDKDVLAICELLADVGAALAAR
jgi:anaphase-promoting complex subunit 5